MNTDRQFVNNSSVDFLVPQDTDIDIEHALSTAESPAGEEVSVLSRIPQRTLLYFDEKVPIYAVLRTPYQDDETLHEYIPRLNVALEAHAFSSPAIMSPTADTHATTTLRDVIWASKLDVSEDPIFVVVGSDEDEDGRDVLLMWKMTAFLNRPRVRLQAPAVIFKTSATLQLRSPSKARSAEDYLPSGALIPANVLAPLNDAIPESKPRAFLSASRLYPSLRPKETATAESMPLRVISRRAFRAIPAVSSRLRYHRSSTVKTKNNILASLELDIPTFAQHPIQITKVGLGFTGGQKQPMLNETQLGLPATFNAKDNLVCLFAVDPDSLSHPYQNPNAKALDVTIDVRVSIADNCRPHVQIRWRQSIDIAAIVQQGAPKTTAGLTRDHRPTSLMTASHAHAESNDSTTRISHANVTASVTGAHTIHVGEPFLWDVSIVNRSERTRQFSMTMIPKRRNTEGGRSRLRAGSLPGNAASALAEAVVDENVLYATIKSQDLEPAQLACLSPNAQTNVMRAGAIYTTQLEFLPLRKGCLQMEAIRITDLDSGDAVDVRNLPDVVALERSIVA